MSLAIDLDRVSAVLLADGWHQVSGDSFTMDSWEFIWDQGTKFDGRKRDPYVFDMGSSNGGCYLGFQFEETDGSLTSGPITAIVAVRHRAQASRVKKRNRGPSQSKRRPIPLRTRFAVLQRDGFRCRHCGASPDAAELQLDHIVPVSAGGKDDPDNLLTSCFECNNGRGARSLA